jgi:hypothetical protein
MGRAKKTIEIGEPVNGAVPQADDDGIVTQFVNISRAHQNVCVPNNSAATIMVKRMAVLNGEQWRDPYTKEAHAWGTHPFFIERVKGVDKVTDENPGGYDTKYVLTEEQALAEIGALGITKKAKMRIQFLTDNAIFRYDEFGNELMIPEIKNPNQFVPARDRDDRSVVIRAAADKIRVIEDMLEKRAREMGSI